MINTENTVLFMGRLEYRKGITFFRKVLKCLPGMSKMSKSSFVEGFDIPKGIHEKKDNEGM